MAELVREYGSYYLEDPRTGEPGANLYPAPNPAISEFLLDDRLQAVVAEYTTRTGMNYIARLGNRPGRAKNVDEHPGALAGTVRLTVFVGGYRADRWVGQVTVGDDEIVYAMADEVGRHQYNPYPGHHDLRDALHDELGQTL